MCSQHVFFIICFHLVSMTLWPCEENDTVKGMVWYGFYDFAG